MARMQLRHKMRLPEAKKYAADKPKVGVMDLADSTVLRGLRQELDVAVIAAVPGARRRIEAKRDIAELLDVCVPCLKRLQVRREEPRGVARETPGHPARRQPVV